MIRADYAAVGRSVSAAGSRPPARPGRHSYRTPLSRPPGYRARRLSGSGRGGSGGAHGVWGGTGPGPEGAVEGVGVVVGEQVGDLAGGHGAVGEVVAGQVLAGAGEDGLEGGSFGLELPLEGARTGGEMGATVLMVWSPAGSLSSRAARTRSAALAAVYRSTRRLRSSGAKN